MKRLLLSFVALACIAAKAQTTFQVGDITYLVKDNQRVELTKYAGTAASVTIPATVTHEGTTYDVKSIGEKAFLWTHVETAVLPASIDSIKEQAFYYSYLKSVNFPDGLKYIGNRSFASCKMTSIDVPGSVEVIDDNAFFSCPLLEEITFHEGLKKIGQAAFYHNPKLTRIVFPNSLEYIGKTAFNRCDGVETIQFPSHLTYIGAAAFGDCRKLREAALPSSVTYIGNEAFMKCFPLTSFTIPKETKEIGFSIISMTAVQTLNVEAGNTHFHLVDGVVYDTGNKVLYVMPMKGMTTLNVKEGCIGINGGVAWGSELQSVKLPKSLLAIGEYAFEKTAITQIDLPENLTYIGDQAFADTKLTNVIIPQNVVYMTDGAFAQCKELVSATLPSSVAMVYNHAFGYNEKFTTLTCLGSKAPAIDSYGEEYDSPFFKIKTNAVLNVPKGCTQSYKDQGWGAYFKIQEMASGVLVPKATDPASGTTVSGYKSLAFKIEFNEAVSIVKANPNVTLRKDNLLFANIFTPDQSWMVTQSADKTSINVWASDYDSYTQAYKFENDHVYFIVIPPGIVKNAAGDMNERIVIKLQGAQSTSIDQPTTATESRTVTGYYDIEGRKLSAPQQGITIVKYSDGSTQKILTK